MQWCLKYLVDEETIFDPYMGSGTTLIAAIKAGKKAIGIEICPAYFDIACQRISDACKQTDMFLPPAEPLKSQEIINYE